MKLRNKPVVCGAVMALFAAFMIGAVENGAHAADARSSDYQCLKFDGKKSVVNIGDLAAFNGTQLLTVEMWVRIDTFSAWRTFFGKFQDLQNRVQFQEYSSAGKLAVVVDNNAHIKTEGNQAYYFTSEPVVTIGDWFHLAMVFDGSKPEGDRMLLYINGMKRALQRDSAAHGAIPTAMPSTKAPILLGAEKPSGSFGYKGLMDEVRIWNVARSEAEIRSTMNGSLSGNEPGLAVYYPIDAADLSAAGKGMLLRDHAAGKHDARLANFNPKEAIVPHEEVVPTVQSSGVQVGAPSPDGATISWKRGSGSSNVVFATNGNEPMPQLAPNTTYKADPVFGKGTRVGESGWYCVYNGNDATASVAGLQPSTSYKVAVLDYNGGAGREQYLSSSSEANALAVTTPSRPKIAQTVMFAALPEARVGQADLLMSGAASSGLAVSYKSSDTAVAKFIGAALHLVAPGNALITASQAGSERYTPAVDVTQVLTVKGPVPAPVAQVIKSSHGAWWKNKLVLLGAGGGALVAVVVGVLIANHGSEGSDATDRGLTADKPPSDPL